MKNKLLMSLLALVCAFMVSCSDDEGSVQFSSGDNADVYTITCTKADAWQHFVVSSTVDWTVSTNDSWIHLAKSSYLAKETVGMFKVSAFTGYTSRTGTIYVKAGDKTITITVIQMGEPSVKFAQSSYQVTNKNTSFLVNVSTNAVLAAGIEYVERNGTEETLIASPTEWLSCVVVDGSDSNTKQVAITALANDTEHSRYARIIVKDTQSETSDTIHLEQLEKDVFRIATDGNQTAESYVLSSWDTETVSFTIDSNVDYTEEISEDGASWIRRETATTRYVRETLTYVVDASNEYDSRTGTITLQPEGLDPIVFTITQPGHPMFKFFTVSESSEIYEASGVNCDGVDVYRVKYWTNFADFEVVSNDDWLTIINRPDDETDPIDNGKGMSGSTTAVCFGVSKNNMDARTGSITVQRTSSSEDNKTFNVTQNKFTPSAKISAESRTMFYGGDDVDYDDYWDALTLLDDETSSPNFEYDEIKWSSDKPLIATIDENTGKISTHGVTATNTPVTLTAKIKLKEGYLVKEYSRTCKLTVASVNLADAGGNKVTSLELDPNDDDKAGATLNIAATNFTVQNAVWSIVDKTIAEVDNTGLDAKKQGRVEALDGEGGETTLLVEVTTGNDKLDKITLSCSVTVLPKEDTEE